MKRRAMMGILLGTALAAQDAWAQEKIKLSVGSAAAPAWSLGKGLHNVLKPNLEKYTDGRVEVTVHGGGALLQPIVAARLLRRVAGDESPSHSLTEREFEVLRLLARGKLNKEIAGELAITERTVKFHVSAILGKLGAGNRTEAVRIAAQHGLIDLS